jgi:hypothetical protein
MAEKIKVLNPLKSKITINLVLLNGKQIPVASKGFAYVTAEELAYIQNTSKAFELGFLKVDPKAALPEEIEIPDSPNSMTDEDITKLLKKPSRQVEYHLANIENVHVARRILELAKEQDKSVKVVEVIQARLEALLQ